MGKSSVRITGDQWRPTDVLSGVEAIAHLSFVYQLPADTRLWELFDGVRDRGSRERVQGWSTERHLNERNQIIADLKQLKKLGKNARKSLSDLHISLEQFDERFNYSRAVEDVIKAKASSSLTLSSDFEWLFRLSRTTAETETLRRDLQALIDLPLRKTRGRIAHKTLNRCVADCCSYWKLFGRTCGVEGLQDDDRRNPNSPALLLGDFERFISDVMRLAGIDHDLEQLYGAMSKPKSCKAAVTQLTLP